MVVYRHVGRDVRATGGVSIDTAQPVGGVTLRLRLRITSIMSPPLLLSLSLSLSDKCYTFFYRVWAGAFRPSQRSVLVSSH